MKNIITTPFINFLIITILVLSCSGGPGLGSSSTDSGDTNTLNGSYAKILSVGNYLYAINDEELTTFDITNEAKPIKKDAQLVGFSIENIFHSNGVLFIGSEEALHIFSIEKDGIPLRKSETSYFENDIVTSCDPVIVSNNLAYVTLSTRTIGNSRCRRFVQINELRIYDVMDIENPKLLSITNMAIPKGLGIDGQYLFVCLEDIGVIVLDVLDPNNPIEITTLSGFKSYDVITKNGLLMVVGPEEIRQYDYTDINNIEYLSSIDI